MTGLLYSILHMPNIIVNVNAFVPCIKCNVISFTKHHNSSTVLDCWTCTVKQMSWYPTSGLINLQVVEL